MCERPCNREKRPMIYTKLQNPCRPLRQLHSLQRSSISRGPAGGHRSSSPWHITTPRPSRREGDASRSVGILAVLTRRLRPPAPRHTHRDPHRPRCCRRLARCTSGISETENCGRKVMSDDTVLPIPNLALAQSYLVLSTPSLEHLHQCAQGAARGHPGRPCVAYFRMLFL